MSRNTNIYVPKSDSLDNAKELIEQDYFLDAIKILQKLQKSKSNSYSIKYDLALAWATSGISVDRAEKFFRKLVNSDWVMSNLSRVELSKILLCKKEYEEALENLEVAVKDKRVVLYASTELIYLFLRTGEYDKALKIYNDIKNDNFYWGPSRKTQIETYLRYKQGKITDQKILRNYYFGSQLVNFREDKTIEHIKLHLDEDDVKDIHSMFLDDVNIEDVYSNSKTRITSINPLSVSIVDKYTLSFDRPIGVINQEETDAVSVVTFPNTHDILSIYPVHNPKTRVKKYS